MWTILWILLGLFTALHLAISYVVYHALIRSPRGYGIDHSNRINHIRLVWFAISRPELFGAFFPGLNKYQLFLKALHHEHLFKDVPGFWWMRYDELQNIRMGEDSINFVHATKGALDSVDNGRSSQYHFFTVTKQRVRELTREDKP